MALTRRGFLRGGGKAAAAAAAVSLLPLHQTEAHARAILAQPDGEPEPLNRAPAQQATLPYVLGVWQPIDRKTDQRVTYKRFQCKFCAWDGLHEHKAWAHYVLYHAGEFALPVRVGDAETGDAATCLFCTDVALTADDLARWLPPPYREDR